MPLIDINDPVHLGITVRAERQWGHPSTRAEVRLVYPRLFVLEELRRRWAWLVPALGLTPTSSIVLIGAAYGYSLEVLASEHGITRVIGIETATGLRTKMAQSEDAEVQAAIEAVGLTITTGDGLRLYGALRDRPGLARSLRAADVLNEDLAGNASRNRVRNAILAKGGTTWDVLTENVLTVLSDAECTTLATRARSISGIARLIHLVSTPKANPLAGYNWKNIQSWGTLLPNDSTVSLYTREVAGASL